MRADTLGAELDVYRRRICVSAPDRLAIGIGVVNTTRYHLCDTES